MTEYGITIDNENLIRISEVNYWLAATWYFYNEVGNFNFFAICDSKEYPENFKITGHVYNIIN